jgi:hypothetical protein
VPEATRRRLTSDTYSHVAAEVAHEVAERIGKALRGAHVATAVARSPALMIKGFAGGAGGVRTRDRRIMSPLL